MVKRLSALVAALCLIWGSACADLSWKEKTPAQKMLKTYITNVNSFLTAMGEMEVNTIFEQYDNLAEMGITATENAESAENSGVTVTVYLYYDSINSLLLRVNDPARFPRIAAAFLQGLSPEVMTAEDALKTPYERTQKAVQNPLNSFEDEVEELNGTVPRVYYAYYPNQYHDGVSWLQMTVIFPLEGYWDEVTGILSEETPEKKQSRDAGTDKEYDGYFSSDDYEHLEVFTTATPEPDSAAAEYDDFWHE